MFRPKRTEAELDEHCTDGYYRFFSVKVSTLRMPASLYPIQEVLVCMSRWDLCTLAPIPKSDSRTASGMTLVIGGYH
jgi:hypothetical protein